MTISERRSGGRGQEKRAKIIESFRATGNISKTAEEIGTTCGTVRKWLKRHARDPACGLLDAPRSGRPSKVARLAGDANAMKVLEQALHDKFSLSSIQKLLIERMDIWVGRTCLGEFVRAHLLDVARPHRPKPKQTLKKRKRHEQEAEGKLPKVVPTQIEADDKRNRKKERSGEEEKGKLNDMLAVEEVPLVKGTENPENERFEVPRHHQKQEKTATGNDITAVAACERAGLCVQCSGGTELGFEEDAARPLMMLFWDDSCDHGPMKARLLLPTPDCPPPTPEHLTCLSLSTRASCFGIGVGNWTA